MQQRCNSALGFVLERYAREACGGLFELPRLFRRSPGLSQAAIGNSALDERRREVYAALAARCWLELNARCSCRWVGYKTRAILAH